VALSPELGDSSVNEFKSDPGQEAVSTQGKGAANITEWDRQVGFASGVRSVVREERVSRDFKRGRRPEGVEALDYPIGNLSACMIWFGLALNQRPSTRRVRCRWDSSCLKGTAWPATDPVTGWASWPLPLNRERSMPVPRRRPWWPTGWHPSSRYATPISAARLPVAGG
jgi:hypothetical protein